MSSLPVHIGELSKVQQLMLAVLAGAVSTLAMAPVSFWPVLFFTLPVLIWLIDIAQGHEATNTPSEAHSVYAVITRLALTGWAFGFGYFFVSLYWIGSSFLVEFDKFGWALPFAVTLLPAGLAMFYAAGFALTYPLWTKGPSRIFTFSLAIFIVDWLRGHILTGFPWNLIGHSLTGQLEFMQNIPLFGIYGLSALAAFIFASPATLLNLKSDKPAEKFINSTPVLLSLLLLAGLWSYGVWRLNQLGPTSFRNHVELVIVQPNIAQRDKISTNGRIASLKKTIQLTEKLPPLDKSKHQQRLIIWPETAIAFALNKSPEILKRLEQLIEPDTTLITGAFQLKTGDHKAANPAEIKIYNSLFVINHQGKITARFDKHHLVPFGEYLPFPKLFRAIGLKALAEERGGFAIGPEAAPVELTTDLSFWPSICYEAIFPLSSSIRSSGATWLLNISNDAWFGQTVGPYQHAHHVRLRAVETGLPMVRVVNGGISVIYDGAGRETQKTKLNTIQVLSAKLPETEQLPATIMQAEIFALTILGFIFVLFNVGQWLIYEKKK